MKTYPLMDKVRGHVYAFEIENVYIGINTIVRQLNLIDGVSDARAQKMFSMSYDMRAELKYQGKDCVVVEPFGDSSRYWIGSRNPEDVTVDVHKIEEAFRQYRPPFIRQLLGDILTFRVFSRLFGKA
jgi:hypothetical protein